MISNAVTNMPASSGPARSGNPGRGSGETDNAFRDVLDKSSKSQAEAEASGKDADAAETRPRSALADTRWHASLRNASEETAADGDAEAKGSGDKTLTGGDDGAQSVQVDVPGKTQVDDALPGEDGAKKTPAKAGTEAAEAAAQHAGQAAGVAAKAASPDANASARAGEVAGQNARPAGKAAAKDALASPAAAAAVGEAADDPAARADGKRADSVPAVNGDRRAGPPAAGNVAQTAPGAAARPDMKAGQPVRQAASHAEQGRHDTSPIRVTGDANGARGASGDAAGAARPSAEPAGTVARTAGAADVLPGTADTSVGRQVAEAVAREIEELAPSRLSLAGSTAPGGRTVKTMRLQLHPAELGAVNIRMQAVDGELRVTIQADSDQTSRMLHNDSDAIRSALRAAGISGADVVVTGHRNDSAQPQNFGAQHRDPSGQQMAGQNNGQNASSESRQSWGESSSNDSAHTQTRNGDAGDNFGDRGSRITI